MLTALLFAALGTQPVCRPAVTYATAGYGTNYIATPYTQQTYAPTYANKVITAFIPVVQQDYRVEIVGDAARAQAYQAQRLAADSSLISSINNFAKTLDTFRVQVAQATGAQQQAQQAAQASQGPPPAAAPPDPSPSSPGPATGPAGTFQLQPGQLSQVQLAATSTLARRCGACHTGENGSGGFAVLASKDRLASYAPDFLKMLDQVAYRGYVLKADGTKLRMPPNGKGLSTEEYSPIRAALDAAEQEGALASAGGAR